MIAEEARDLLRTGLDAIRPVQRLRLLDPTLRIAAKLAADGPSQNRFVGRHPLEAGLCGKLCRLVRDRPFRRPQPGRLVAEHPLMTLPRPRELLRRIFRTPERGARHRRRRVRLEIDIGVAQQRKNRVVERRCRQLDLPSVGGIAVLGDDAPEYLELDLAQFPFVGLAEAALLLDEPPHARVVVEIERIDPRELVPHLQVEKILVGVSPARVALPQQLGIARIAIDHPPARRVKKFRQRGCALRFGQLVRRLQAELEVPVARPSFGEGFELHEQRRHEVEGQLHLRKLAHQRGHPVVVLQPVHAYPRQHMLARGEVFVVRLVHVPEDGDVSHCLVVSSNRSEC